MPGVAQVSGDVIGTLFDAKIAEHLMRECLNSEDIVNDGVAGMGTNKVYDSAASLADSNESALKEALMSNEQ